jgi:hypothetical protein
MIGIDADRAHPADRIAFEEEVRSYDSPIRFGYDSPAERGADEGLHEALGELERREIERKSVVVIDPAKSLEADPGTFLDVFRLYLAQGNLFRHGGRGRPGHVASLRSMLWLR